MNELAMTAVNHADTLHGALYYLRGNRPDRALEALEMALDVSVVSLKSVSQQVGAADRDLVLSQLRHIRDYRRDHPRKMETDVSRIDKKTVARALELQQEASRILDEIE